MKVQAEKMDFINNIKMSTDRAEIYSLVTSFAQAMQLEQSHQQLPCMRAPFRQTPRHKTELETFAPTVE